MNIKDIKVLIVDDEPTIRQVLQTTLTKRGYSIEVVKDTKGALRQLEETVFHVVVLDIQLPDKDGLAFLKEIRTEYPEIQVIMLTGHADIDTAVESMRIGAHDYLTKPPDIEALDATLQKAAAVGELNRENLLLRHELSRTTRFPELIWRSEKMGEIIQRIEQVAPTDSTVLLQGESGVGKEIAAKAIHHASTRREHQFVVVDCGAFTESLLMNELFGHEKGAYTGADRMKPGLFEVADGGTLFLDEIGEVSPEVQTTLLRVIETGEFRRLGSSRTITVDVRLIAATNQNLQRLKDEGRFREDLFFRLNVFSIVIPPLRERKEDILLLVRHVLDTSAIAGSDAKQLTPGALNILRNYHWPGNVRELKNIIERAVILSQNEEIGKEDIQLLGRRKSDFHFSSIQNSGSYWTLQDLEKEYITWVLQETGGHRRKAAEILGMSERSLYRKIKEYQPHPPNS